MNNIIIIIIACIILGTILHFLYDKTNKNPIVGIFSATNESIWEHLKLSFFPIIIVGVFEYIFARQGMNNFWSSKLIGAIAAMIFTVVAFYTYYGILGKDYFILDIIIFIVSIILGELISYKIMMIEPMETEILSIIGIVIITLIFAIFTKNPPDIPLFQDFSKKDSQFES